MDNSSWVPNRFSVFSVEIQPAVSNVSQDSDIESVIDAMELDLSREENRVQHDAIGTPVPASDTDFSSEMEPDRKSVASEMESPTNINDVSLEEKDVSEAFLSLVQQRGWSWSFLTMWIWSQSSLTEHVCRSHLQTFSSESCTNVHDVCPD